MHSELKTRFAKLEEETRADGMGEIDMGMAEDNVGTYVEDRIPRGVWRDIDLNQGRLMHRMTYVLAPVGAEEEASEGYRRRTAPCSRGRPRRDR